MKWIVCILSGMVLLSGCVKTPEVSFDSVFKPEPLDPFWVETVSNLEGESLEEKSAHALTTLDMLAVAAYTAHVREKELSEAARQVFDSLDAEGQLLFLRTHAAWRNFVELESAWETDENRGGTARPLFRYAIETEEIARRTVLYREFLTTNFH